MPSALFPNLRSKRESACVSVQIDEIPADPIIIIPERDQHPWDVPEGFICLSEKLFTECGVTFPLPYFLMSYFAKRKMAISQFAPATFRNAVGISILAKRAGIRLSVDHFEELTRLTAFDRKKKPGVYYVRHNWEGSYFFLKVVPGVVEDPAIPLFSGWNLSPVVIPRCFLPYPPTFRADIDAIRAVGPYIWPGSGQRKGGRLRKQQVPRPTANAMGRLNLDVPNVSARYRQAFGRPAPPPSSRPEVQPETRPSGVDSSRRSPPASRDSRAAEIRAGKRPASRSYPLPSNPLALPAGADSQGKKPTGDFSRRREHSSNPSQKRTDRSQDRSDSSKRQNTMDYQWDFSHNLAT
ncbi:PREDICTED: uncharacterized protein LOC104789775 isoform X1 [Camelina sativa]|uniref:Uncharacterized protein LOC104789775 isoform X1 n=1 Tax=Camelina sativa TaxID=90675 RepID=A0ABM0ZCC2_CAMSA|nr:PREDICTED: uncharacterized protein LOC104789775 isoform X1 [Camelina sativa]